MGVSHPPANEAYSPSVSTDIPEPSKPSAAHYAQAAAPQQPLQSSAYSQAAPQQPPAPQCAPAAQPQDPDGTIVSGPVNSGRSVQPANAQPQLSQRGNQDFVDPDGDIVHPEPLRPGDLAEGTTIRVRLLNRLSSAQSERGTIFKGRVASDVLSNGQVIIPTGSVVEGQVIKASTGDHLGGSGYLRLRPEILTLPSGVSYRMNSMVSGTPGAHTKVNDEGTIKAGSRKHRDEVEYGGGVGGGGVGGALLGGPAGALIGGAVGAGLVTTHLLVSHTQAVLEPGTVLQITLTSPLHIDMNSGTTAQYAPAAPPAPQN
jgi:hypothetical protein